MTRHIGQRLLHHAKQNQFSVRSKPAHLTRKLEIDRNQALEVLQLLPQTPAELVNAVQGVTSAPAKAPRPRKGKG